MPKTTIAEIGCGSFDRPDLESLNNYKKILLHFAIAILNNLGRVTYCWKNILKKFPTVYITCPQIPKTSIAKPKKQICKRLVIAY